MKTGSELHRWSLSGSDGPPGSGRSIPPSSTHSLTHSLTGALRSLERDGLVTRRVYAEVPPRVEYALTPLGRTLEAPLRALRDWSEAHMAEVETARAAHAAAVDHV